VYKLQADHAHVENQFLFLQSFLDHSYKTLARDNATLIDYWEKWKNSGEFAEQSYSRLQHQLRELEMSLSNSGILLSELQRQLILGQGKALQNSASSWLLWIFVAMLAGALGVGVLFFLPFVLNKLEKYQSKKLAS